MVIDVRRGCMLLILAGGLTGCGGPVDPPTPGTPTTPPPTIPVPSLTVTAISPNVGSTLGGAPLRIVGTGFRAGVRVTLGSVAVPVQPRFDHRDPAGSIMYGEAPAHAAGVVDVVVTDVDGRSVTLAGAFTYAPPSSLSFDGSWYGFGDAGQDIPILFTIRDDALVIVSCDTHATLTFASPPRVVDGAFSYVGADGVVVAGRIVSPMHAVGTIELAPCTGTRWAAQTSWPP